ncbi:hypothetical protein ASPZODRAFT_134161 [Penicilliopsis zonata CBS 506.65]|uniref:Uncharacterized protein n=1 Tax=Penicilliopsis zonata CBS 506.65 TaxID=1073090 RepID=A0A1L9SE39_9EURO|nr:hypothetical protein ASPZODRAFT_134161 [Penicilliopsis zonata CBS 506.65]OJJ45490.1 hypothetical protein ASPZODRAFT_134161 [Penicilliopsis zonata CBS 506.65]
MVSQPDLSTNDAAVLQALFDAESSPSAAVEINSTLPSFGLDPTELAKLQSRELEIIRPLQPESSSTGTTEPATIQSAIQALSALIAENPKYPSAYANRAQAYRLLLEGQEEGKEETDLSDVISCLFADLGEVISLATPKPADPLSPLQARLLADSHTHRGYLLLKAAKTKRMPFSDTRRVCPAKLQSVGADTLEEMASRDFFFGGRYGNKIAQQLAVQTNPYAKMCGAIVKEALKEEIQSYY